MLISFLSNRAEHAKVAKVRTLSRSMNEVRSCWRIIDKVPNGYLPGAMRKLVARILEHSVGATLKLDPENAFFREQDSAEPKHRSSPGKVRAKCAGRAEPEMMTI